MTKWLYLAIGIFGLAAVLTASHFNAWRFGEKLAWLLIDIGRLFRHHPL